MNESRTLQGIGVSPGIGTGPAIVIRRDLPDVPDRVVPADAVEAEVIRLHDAVDSVRRGLEQLRQRARERVGPEEAKIFDAQILMLQDVEFLKGAERLIRDNQLSAERAYEFKALEVRALWANSGSSRLRERVADLSGLQIRILNHLLGQPVDEAFAPTGGRPSVVFLRELTPGLTVQFEQDHVVGFVSEEGTRTSHAAILARSLGIPCVMGLPGVLHEVRSGTEVIIDGARGSVTLSPTAEQVSEAEVAEGKRHTLLRELESVLGQPAVSLDGVNVTLRGNLDLPEELDQLAGQGAEGVGLMRTEFLVVGRADLPSEEEQLDYFRRVARRFAPAPVIVRSFDVGGDKFPAAFRFLPEPNPFLGWRALRVCLDRPEVFLPQLRALLRARIDGDSQLMLPLVVDVSEVVRTRELLAEARASLARDGLRAADDLPVGVMVETPAAAAIADRLAEVSDFLSVGTNDLTQYTLAVDRGNARLAERFTTYHPAIVRMLHAVRDAAVRARLPISVCGELASEPLGAFLLIGLGYRNLSISPVSLPLIRWLVRRINASTAARAAEAAREAATAAEVTRILEEHIAEYVDLGSLETGWLPQDRRNTKLG